MFLGELVHDYVDCAQCTTTTPDAAVRQLVKELIEWRTPPDWCVVRLSKGDLRPLPVLEELEVVVGIALAEPSELRVSSLGVEVHRDLLAIGHGHPGDRVGIDVFESELRDETEGVVLDDRIRLNDRMAGRAGVHKKAGQVLLGSHATTGDWPRVHDGDALASLREIGGRDKGVVTGSRNDDV